MNVQLSKKQLGFGFLGIVLIGILTFGLYYLFILPLNDQIDRKNTELDMARQELDIIDNTLTQNSEQTVLNTMELQKEVPVKRLLDQLLLNVEKAEIVSDATINEIQLNGTQEDENIDLISEEGTVQYDPETEEEQADPEEIVDEDSETSETGEPETPLPNGIKKTSLTLFGESDSYFELEKLLENLLSMERIIKIEELNFTGLQEVYSVEQDTSNVTFEITLAAYYYPALEDLEAELPPVDAPDGSNKSDPLNRFTTEEDEDDTP
ncbi:pilus assembly protein PilO [Cytobacillus gottheilii]|uniref:hypothetical protein n=1 Tax=Cytobacillus gottheilii TaxID=859144 RepID=UPI000834A851|nr:hypothetical protein [Cytobacillus gottheilii]